MSKKNFTGGINSLLGDGPKKKTRTRFQTEIEETPIKESLETIELRKRGRPQTQFKEITKTSQEGTKENETRATFIINEDLLEKLKAIAYWDRVLIKDVVNTALQDTIAKYEKKSGAIKPIPKK
jgi:hypothetical protein